LTLRRPAARLSFAIVLAIGVGATPASAGRTPTVFVVPQSHGGAGYVQHSLLFMRWGPDGGKGARFATEAPSGYSPAQIQHYLGLEGDGTGQTVAISVPFHDPMARSDVNTFSEEFDLPETCGSAPPGEPCFDFTQLVPSKPKQKDDWAMVESVDVEWIHAIAPMASIIVSEARTNTLNALDKAIDIAAAQPGVVVIANSWYGGEFSGERHFDSHCALKEAVCVFSSGSAGHPGGYPAFSPNVVAAGGTTLRLDGQGDVQSETAWSCSNRRDCKMHGGSGGGVSEFEPKPAYQKGVNPYAFRGTPDVSFDADPATGLAVYDSAGYHGQKGWFQVGGTSVSAAAWAAILVVADQLRAGVGKEPLSGKSFLAQTDLYGIQNGLFDVTSGENGSCKVCHAEAGYDFVTGLGSPRPGIDTALRNAT
jgi:subtilase family serine protease